MPYRIEERDGKYCLVKKDGGKLVACHDSKEGAERQERAIYAHENLTARLDTIERALLTFAIIELGEGPGHPFRGNQWRDTGEVSDFRGKQSGVPKGADVVLRRNHLSDNWDVVSGHKDVLGTVTQTGGFGKGNQDDYEALPVGGEPKEFHSVNDAVHHILKETEDLHKLPIAASSQIELGDLPGHEFRGNQYTHSAADELRKEGIDAKVYEGNQIRVAHDELPVEHLKKTAEAAKILEEKGYKTILARHGQDSHIEIKGLSASISERMEALESAVISLSTIELGDVSGHDFHGNQWTGGFGGSVEQFVKDHPKEPGEAVFEWQSRIVKGLDAETQSAVIFATRERYEPCDYMRDAINVWNEQHGLPPLDDRIAETAVPLGEADAAARIFEDTPDQSGDPAVQAAYEDFKAQNAEMYDYLTRPLSEGGLGVTVEFPNIANPYPTAEAQARDLIDNRHISIASGLGGAHEATMTTQEYDQFRAVHDSFGHAAIGRGFDRHGEYEAWLVHSSMYTGAGRDAMTTEYHGVNSALWSGAPGTPGTGKSILLPAEHLTAAATKREVATIVKALKLDSEWATKFSAVPFHTSLTGKLVASASKPPRTTLDRVADLEAAILAFGRIELGDSEGHPFRGNQWTGGIGDGSEEHPFKVSSAEEAAKLISEGKFVELPSHQVSILLDKLHEYAQQAKESGEKAPNYDLCKISVPDTNLFCAESKDIPRIEMPQLSGKPLPGSPADSLPKNDRGEVDITGAFRAKLVSDGFSFASKTVPAEQLKATQNELNGAKIAGMMKSIEAGTLPPGRVFVSRDNYVVDGHHRWAANVGEEYDPSGRSRSVGMDVTQVDMPIAQLLDYSKKFAADMGIPQAAVASVELGDSQGHPFHGNQYTGGQGDDELGHYLTDREGDMMLTKPIQSVVERVAERGGVTIEPLTGTEPSTGYIVATEGNSKAVADEKFFDRMHGVTAIEGYLVDHIDQFNGDNMLGVWHDKEQAEVVLDVVEHIENREEAVRLGSERDQRSIWDVEGGEVINTGGTGGRETASHQAA